MTFQLDLFLAQFINFVLVFFLFKYLVGDKLLDLLSQRRVLQSKLEHAQATVDAIVTDAKSQADTIIAQAVQHKQTLIDEATTLASKKADEVLAKAKQQADKITQDADKQSAQMKQELEQNRTDGVKQTALVVVRKLFDKDVSLQQEYLDMLVKESGVK